MKVALVHDFLIRFGGAERVLLVLKKMFPQAPIYTLVYDQKKMGSFFNCNQVKTSFLQKLPLAYKKHRFYSPLMPAATESLDLRDYDLVISSTSSFSKGLVLRPQAIHICYCHTPTRYLWDWTHQYEGNRSILAKLFIHYLRIWDRAAANRVDYFIANSKTTAGRIKKYYDREARVIYPPVSFNQKKAVFNLASSISDKDLDRLVNHDFKKEVNQNQPKNFFLIISQLTPYKRIDLAVDVFNKLELPLVIIGRGRDKRKLSQLARPNITFLDYQPDEVIQQYYQNCLALIFPGEDDFGLTPVEAMSYGKPVLAYRGGGATESVLEGITGEFFDDPVSESLADGVRRILNNLNNYSPILIKKRAEKFSEERFFKEMSQLIEEVLTSKSLN